MSSNPSTPLTNRRRFLKYMAMLAIGGRELLRSGDLRAAVDATQETADTSAVAGTPENWPKLPRRVLGTTGFEASRLIFGCGAALSGARNDALLHAADRAGINVFDVGSSSFYANAEKNLAPFMRGVRDRVFLISKGMVGLDLASDEEISIEKAAAAAATWTRRLEQSLSELQVDHVDAYYVMAANNPSLIASEEIQAAFAKAKEAGKVRFLGLSTHENAENVLKAAMKTGAYSLAMIAITPAGWYDLNSRAPLTGSEPMVDLQPFLSEVRESGIALVGMKAGRYLAGRRLIGWSNEGAYDGHYGAKFMASGLSSFQRSYAYVLAHGLDVVNADMQSLEHLGSNIVATARSSEHFG